MGLAQAHPNNLRSSIGGIEVSVIWQCHIHDKSTPLDYEQCGAHTWAWLSGARSCLPNNCIQLIYWYTWEVSWNRNSILQQASQLVPHAQLNFGSFYKRHSPSCNLGKKPISACVCVTLLFCYKPSLSVVCYPWWVYSANFACNLLSEYLKDATEYKQYSQHERYKA